MFACFVGTATAQRRSSAALTYGGGGTGGSNFESGYAISLGIGYNAPLNYLKDLYKPAIAYHLGLARFMDKFTVSVNLGYHAYKGKDDPFGLISAEVDDEPVPTQNTKFVLPDYKVYSGYASIVYNIDLAEAARLYGGVNLGGYYTYNYDFYVRGDGTLGTYGHHVKNFYVAPRLGVIFGLTEHIGLSLESTYNFFTPLEKSPSGISTGFYTAVAAQAAIIYKF